MNLDFVFLVLRGVQALFAIIVLGTAAYVASATSGQGYWGYYYTAPSYVGFVIFASIWTLLVVAYQILAPRFFPKAAHKFAVLAVDAVTMLFWFAGAVAFAVGVGLVTGPTSNFYKTAQASVAFCFFEWILFVATTVLLALRVFRGGAGKHDTGVEAHTGV